MAARERVGRIALASLGLALALVAIGKVMEYRSALPFLGGLIAAFGEAALIGGLADWFAVRALFAHPLGVPLPHTALIPRNRKRLTAEIRKLVVNEWLPRDVLTRKVEGFDFVEQGILTALPELRPHLRELLRNTSRELLTRAEPREIASWVASGVSVRTQQIAPWLAELIAQAREQNWLEPVLREVVVRLEAWASSPACRKFIHQRLEQAAENYRQRGGWKDLMLTIGEISGGVDLIEASAAVQSELRRFASDQMSDGSHMKTMLRDGLANLESRLRYDLEFLASVRGELEQSDTLASILERVLTSLREEALAQFARDDSPWLELAMTQADAWVARLREDESLRARINDWCRRFVVNLLEKHHALIGVLVEEQMNRLSDESLTQLIQKRVGEDLNWIRLNGTFVGGLIGVALYLIVALARWANG